MKSPIKLARFIHSPAVINLIFAGVLKSASLLYSIVVVGLSARVLGRDSTALLLLAFNLLVPLSLVQAGAGVLVLRAVSHAHARKVSLGSVEEVRTALILVGFLALIAGIFVVFMFPLLHLGFLVPVALLTLVGLVASVADQVRTAIERSWSSNVCMLASYLTTAVAFVVVRRMGMFSLQWASILSYGAPGFASVISFVALTRNAEFRQAIDVRRRTYWRKMLRQAAPILAISAGSAVFLNIPGLGSWMDFLPKLSSDNLVLFRISTLFVSAMIFFTAPVIPTIIRHEYAGQVLGTVKAISVFGASVTLLSITAGLLVGLFGDQLAKLWLGRGLSHPAGSRIWGLELAIWLMGSISAQYGVITRDPQMIARGLWLCNLITLSLLLVFGAQASWNVPLAMLIGLCFYAARPTADLFKDAWPGLRR